MSQNYILRNEQYEPINVIPDRKIKCVNCDKLFPKDQIVNHLNNHILPSQLRPKNQGSQPARISFNDLLKTDESQSMYIAVRTMRDEDISHPQTQRRRVLFPEIQQKQNHFLVSPSEGRNSLPDQILQAPILRDRKVQSEDIKILSIQTPIIIQKGTKGIQKKKIHVYENLNEQIYQKDEHLQPQKKKLRYYPQNICSFPYEISDAKDTDNSNQTPKNIQTIPIRYNWQPRNPIQTKTKVDPFLTPKKGDSHKILYSSGRQTQYSTTNNHDSKHICPSCKGFYCSFCKSDIPPIYRPPNIQFIENQERDQWWKRFYQERYNRYCQNCIDGGRNE